MCIFQHDNDSKLSSTTQSPDENMWQVMHVFQWSSTLGRTQGGLERNACTMPSRRTAAVIKNTTKILITDYTIVNVWFFPWDFCFLCLFLHNKIKHIFNCMLEFASLIKLCCHFNLTLSKKKKVQKLSLGLYLFKR